MNHSKSKSPSKLPRSLREIIHAAISEKKITQSEASHLAVELEIYRRKWEGEGVDHGKYITMLRGELEKIFSIFCGQQHGEQESERVARDLKSKERTNSANLAWARAIDFLRDLKTKFPQADCSHTAARHIPREPFVRLGEVVDYIGAIKGRGFIGGRIAKEIAEWDGNAFPVTLSDYEVYYDTDLSCFLREVPEGFWKNPKNKIYNNVHTYVRMQRYGETLKEAAR